MRENMGAVAFFAYPGMSAVVKDAISHAVELSAHETLQLKPWEAMDIIGFKLDDLIREQIHDADVLAADITYPNHNVFYEIGYAIAVGKSIIPTVDTAIKGAVAKIQKIGLFDTTGWVTYENGTILSEQLRNWHDISWKNKYSQKRNFAQPLFILDTLKKTDFRNQIFHTVENSQVNYRTFDPVEIPRLTASQAIGEISSSAGVIIPIINKEIEDFDRHNLRASFLLGLCHGYDIEALVIQYEHDPAPLDYRDFITNSTYRHETETHVKRYCEETLIRNQRPYLRERQPSAGLLEEIDIGSPAAENEMQQLGFYFVKTAEFSRALRAEGAIVVGRKGSGKSAIFFQIAETKSRDRKLCIVDLRPASHNLSEMREALLSIINVGVFDHTIAAFWQYIIYVEILLKIREMVLPLSRNDSSLQRRIMEVEEKFSLNESIVSGDFTSRLETAVKDVVYKLKEVGNASDFRTIVTNIMFEDPIPNLRNSIISFQNYFNGIFILIDDLDKGWPPRRVEPHDVAMVKHLIEVLNRIQRDFSKKNIGFRHLLFLRSDIYERLIEHTSDRGKYNLIKVDWSDPEQLRNLLKIRAMSAIDKNRQEDAWAALNPSVNGEDAIGRMIDNSLRRPRFLIDLCERTLSFAINRGHSIVLPEDVEDAIKQMSLYLVSDFGYEMRDVAGTPEDIFYRFIGVTQVLTEAQLYQLLSDDKLGIDQKEMIDLLLWYGFLGIVSESNIPVYIYNLAYDFRRLDAERQTRREEIRYSVNPAFLKGLR